MTKYNFHSHWEDDDGYYEDSDYDEDEPEDEFVLICDTEGCLMPCEHYLSECHTAADIEAYDRYHNPTWWQRIYDWAIGLWHGVVRQPIAAWRRWRDRKLCRMCGKHPCDQHCDGLPF